ncbi:MAG: hypothetical protein ABIQ57_14225 [Candidatus Kapaibacterium sp.]
MDITKIWMVDTVNFTVRTIKSLPFHIGATEPFDIGFATDDHRAITPVTEALSSLLEEGAGI